MNEQSPPSSESKSPRILLRISECCDRFEAEWKQGLRPELSAYVSKWPPADRAALLNELVILDLGYRWQEAESLPVVGARTPVSSAASTQLAPPAGPLLEEYVQKFPELGPLDALSLPLIQEEFRVRTLAGECPTRASYRARFPTHEGLEAALAEVEQELDSQKTAPQLGPHTPTPRGELKIRCLYCRTMVQVVVDSEVTDITCTSCGSTFSLLGEGTETRSAPPVKTIGHFNLLERLGVGGFGSVWKAHDTELDRTVAVKIPRQGQLTNELAEQFFREARAAAQLSHPGIVAVYEVGREGETLYIVSDFVRGVSLSEWMRSGQPAADESAVLAAKIARALHFAHERGIVHRDFKPSNVMMDIEGEPHLLDFGLAKRDVGELTMTADGQVLGTPAYMSPEQGEGESHFVDRRTDIYSLGVVLFQMLTGELPFQGNAQMQIYQRLAEEAPNPRKLNQFIPLDLATICIKCMERDPNRRYKTAADLAKDLESYLRGETIAARPVTRTERTIRWCKRNPWLALAGALILFLAVAGPATAIRIESLRAELATRYAERENFLEEKSAELSASAKEKNALAAELQLLSGQADPWKTFRVKEVQESHKRLLKEMAANEEALLSSINGEASLSERIYALLAFAVVREELGQDEHAIALLEEARELLRTAGEEFASGASANVALAHCLRQLAKLNLDTDRAVARKYLEESEAITGEIVKTGQDPLSYTDLYLTELELVTTQGVEGGLENLERANQLQADFSAQLPNDPKTLYLLSCYLAQREPVLVTRKSKPDAEVPVESQSGASRE